MLLICISLAVGNGGKRSPGRVGKHLFVDCVNTELLVAKDQSKRRILGKQFERARVRNRTFERPDDHIRHVECSQERVNNLRRFGGVELGNFAFAVVDLVVKQGALLTLMPAPSEHRGQPSMDADPPPPLVLAAANSFDNSWPALHVRLQPFDDGAVLSGIDDGIVAVNVAYAKAVSAWFEPKITVE